MQCCIIIPHLLQRIRKKVIIIVMLTCVMTCDFYHIETIVMLSRTIYLWKSFSFNFAIPRCIQSVGILCLLKISTCKFSLYSVSLVSAIPCSSVKLGEFGLHAPVHKSLCWLALVFSLLVTSTLVFLGETMMLITLRAGLEGFEIKVKQNSLYGACTFGILVVQPSLVRSGLVTKRTLW